MASKPVVIIIGWYWLWLQVLSLGPISSSADPQTKLLNQGCSQYNATDFTDFFANLNATFSDLRAQLRGGDKRFATAQQARGSDPVYAMAQCRDYLSTADCAACFAAAEKQIRNCAAANGARVIYDGCLLRYEANGFFDQTTLPGNVGICGKQTIPHSPAAFTSAVDNVLSTLQAATPKINGFFAAEKKVVSTGGGNLTVCGVAQCAQTVSSSGCLDCLKVAFANLQHCLPHSDGRAVDAGCFLRYSNASFFADNQTTNLAPFLNNGSSSEKAIIGGVAGGVGALVLLIIVGIFIWFKRYSKKKQAVARGNILGGTELQGPVNYKYKDLKSATMNFSEENKLGEGGFGDVYKGSLGNGKIVAVKRLAIGQTQRGKADFESEVRLISNVHHRNLVRLLGCCNNGRELLLVYEFMPNSSLDRFLFGDQRRGNLNWSQRHNIIMGTARGLAYLHEEFHVCIIHRDIKTSNILLDDDFNPRIADFGLAKLLPQDQSHLSTRFAGTLGYTAPEYAIHGQLSEKADTYSYGVVVLEIISGQKSTEIKESEQDGQYLLQRAWNLYESNKHIELLDENLEVDEYEGETVKKIIEIALMCVQSSPAMRPTMSEVVVLLKTKNSSSVMEDSRPPTRPVFVDVNQKPRGDTSTSTASSTTSNATASISRISGR
ncbi:cold-responsive protein kinase 1-like isoform X2 [Humulus lupulus]|uniref:cold-responsive protein kinase 1-like isoform X2 n=1 Tax=Humulus lupulus TaxID=3486 RepID=UPI002B4031C3|nr:cold-responsive protein kinase 1-like isoform X2 [Humulus lupulus]